MPDKLPQVSGKEVAKVLLRLGFSFKSQRGSHMKFERSASGVREIVIVPNHSPIRKTTLRGILAQLRLSSKDLKNLL